MSEELFTFLASEERVDRLIAQFGSFYEFAKRRVTGELYGTQISKKEKEKLDSFFRPVIGGEYIREKSKDFIKTKWGKVPLQVSSSGQQEALPLLFSLMEYPDETEQSQLLIIEEPEAHLFPAAQKYILELMVKQAIDGNCKILFTTHSPYMLACLNNQIAKQQFLNERPDIEIDAYFAEGGNLESILEKETKLIDVNVLDSVSEEIANEFLETIK